MKTTAKSKLSIIILVISLMFTMVFITGCKPIENLIVDEPDSNEMVNGPMSELEFSNSTDRILNDAINDGTIILGRVLDINRGSLSPNDEIAKIEDSIDKVQKNIDKLTALTPPSTCLEQQENAISLLKDYKESLKNYYAVLSSEQYDLIPTCTDNIKSSISSVKTACGTIQ